MSCLCNFLLKCAIDCIKPFSNKCFKVEKWHLHFDALSLKQKKIIITSIVYPPGDISHNIWGFCLSKFASLPQQIVSFPHKVCFNEMKRMPWGCVQSHWNLIIHQFFHTNIRWDISQNPNIPVGQNFNILLFLWNVEIGLADKLKS